MMERKHSLWAGVAIATTVVGIGLTALSVSNAGFLANTYDASRPAQTWQVGSMEPEPQTLHPWRGPLSIAGMLMLLVGATANILLWRARSRQAAAGQLTTGRLTRTAWRATRVLGWAACAVVVVLAILIKTKLAVPISTQSLLYIVSNTILVAIALGVPLYALSAHRTAPLPRWMTYGYYSLAVLAAPATLVLATGIEPNTQVSSAVADHLPIAQVAPGDIWPYLALAPAAAVLALMLLIIGRQLAHRTKRTAPTNGATTHAKA